MRVRSMTGRAYILPNEVFLQQREEAFIGLKTSVRSRGFIDVEFTHLSTPFVAKQRLCRRARRKKVAQRLHEQGKRGLEVHAVRRKNQVVRSRRQLRR